MNIKRNWPLTAAALGLLGAVAGVSAGCGESGDTTAENAGQLKEQAAAAAGEVKNKAREQAEKVFTEPEESAPSADSGAADTEAKAEQTSPDQAATGSQAKAEDQTQPQEQTQSAEETKKTEAMQVAAKEKSGASSGTEGKTPDDQAAEESGGKTAQAASGGASGKPYKVNCEGDKCTAGEAVIVGYHRYHATCHVCHGPTADGSSFGPSLVDGLKTMEKGEFIKIVATGRKTYQSWNQNWSVMPAWGTNAAVMADIEGLWAFLKARSDGALPAGRPEPMAGVDTQKIEEEASKMKEAEKPSGH